MSVIFPKWLNALPTVAAVAGVGGLTAVVGGFWYWATPSFWEVGFMPTQPYFGFNHQLHAGKLGLDCRYCHTKIESSDEANIPSVATCYGCHADGHVSLQPAQNERAQFVRDLYTQDRAIEWRRVHKLPDYVRNFPHSVHIKAGVSCFSCHGQITAMPVVTQEHSISMSWCLSCHRSVKRAIDGRENPAKFLVPQGQVTNLKWVEEEWMARPSAHESEAREILKSLRTAPPDNCGACHF